jgi:hypothetical protein
MIFSIKHRALIHHRVFPQHLPLLVTEVLMGWVSL